MPLGATIYVFNIELANLDRGVYQPLQLRVARHPSESEEYFLTRILAYCLEYTEGISFSNGLFEPDEPTMAARLSLERIHRVEALELYALDREWLANLAAKLARRMEFSLTVAEQHVYLSLGEETLPCVIERIAVGRP